MPEISIKNPILKSCYSVAETDNGANDFKYDETPLSDTNLNAFGKMSCYFYIVMNKSSGGTEGADEIEALDENYGDILKNKKTAQRRLEEFPKADEASKKIFYYITTNVEKLKSLATRTQNISVASSARRKVAEAIKYFDQRFRTFIKLHGFNSFGEKDAAEKAKENMENGSSGREKDTGEKLEERRKVVANSEYLILAAKGRHIMCTKESKMHSIYGTYTNGIGKWIDDYGVLYASLEELCNLQEPLRQLVKHLKKNKSMDNSIKKRVIEKFEYAIVRIDSLPEIFASIEETNNEQKASYKILSSSGYDNEITENANNQLEMMSDYESDLPRNTRTNEQADGGFVVIVERLAFMIAEACALGVRAMLENFARQEAKRKSKETKINKDGKGKDSNAAKNRMIAAMKANSPNRASKEASWKDIQENESSIVNLKEQQKKLDELKKQYEDLTMANDKTKTEAQKRKIRRSKLDEKLSAVEGKLKSLRAELHEEEEDLSYYENSSSRSSSTMKSIRDLRKKCSDIRKSIENTEKEKATLNADIAILKKNPKAHTSEEDKLSKAIRDQEIAVFEAKITRQICLARIHGKTNIDEYQKMGAEGKKKVKSIELKLEASEKELMKELEELDELENDDKKAKEGSDDEDDDKESTKSSDDDDKASAQNKKNAAKRIKDLKKSVSKLKKGVEKHKADLDTVRKAYHQELSDLMNALPDLNTSANAEDAQLDLIRIDDPGDAADFKLLTRLLDAPKRSNEQESPISDEESTKTPRKKKHTPKKSRSSSSPGMGIDVEDFDFTDEKDNTAHEIQDFEHPDKRSTTSEEIQDFELANRFGSEDVQEFKLENSREIQAVDDTQEFVSEVDTPFGGNFASSDDVQEFYLSSQPVHKTNLGNRDSSARDIEEFVPIQSQTRSPSIDDVQEFGYQPQLPAFVNPKMSSASMNRNFNFAQNSRSYGYVQTQMGPQMGGSWASANMFSPPSSQIPGNMFGSGYADPMVMYNMMMMLTIFYQQGMARAPSMPWMQPYLGASPSMFRSMDKMPLRYWMNNPAFGSGDMKNAFDMDDNSGLQEDENSQIYDRLDDMTDKWKMLRAAVLTYSTVIIHLFGSIYDIYDFDEELSDLVQYALIKWIKYCSKSLQRMKPEYRDNGVKILHGAFMGYAKDTYQILENALQFDDTGLHGGRETLKNMWQIMQTTSSKDRFFNPQNKSMRTMYRILKNTKMVRPEDVILGDIYKKGNGLGGGEELDAQRIFVPSFSRSGIGKAVTRSSG